MITSSTTLWSPFSIGEGLWLFVSAKFWQNHRVYGRNLICCRIQQIIPAIPVKNGYVPLLLDEMFAHVFRKPVIAVVLAGMLKEQVVVDIQKLFPILVTHSTQVADNPTNLFKIPVVRQTNQSVISTDVRREGELPATERAEVALTKSGTLTSHEVHVVGGLCLHFFFVDWVGGAFISAQTVPELGVGFQVSPLFF